MKQEQYNQAAIEYEDSLIYASVSEQCDVQKAFITGANWRINSAWHEVSERPYENEPIIIERENGKFSLHEKGYDGPWKYNVEQFNFKRWHT